MRHFMGYYTAFPLKMYGNLSNQNEKTFHPITEIGQKITNSQLLFLALMYIYIYII